MATPTSAKNLKLINSAYKDMEKIMVQLYSRWLDEKRFENIEDYGDVIEKNLPKGIQMVRVLKRPFGFVFSVGTEAQYRMFIDSSNQYGWDRIK